jgi:GntR family transcriptional repressor for pyruvate dehydrogenase complex
MVDERPDPSEYLTEYLNPLPERPTVIETLIQQILSLIVEAGLRPGDRLPSEHEIIAATRASRPSVREALRALKTMGIIETRPGSGSFVKSIEPASFIRPEMISLVLMGESFHDILEARKVLECEVARLAALRDRDELAQLETVLDEMRSQVESGQDLYEITWAFHMTLAEVAGNPVMAKLVHILYEMIRKIQLAVYWPKVDPREELEGHEKLYRAVLQGEEEAELAMREHLDRVLSVVEQDLEDSKVSRNLV